jgi:hypothetical protein
MPGSVLGKNRCNQDRQAGRGDHRASPNPSLFSLVLFFLVLLLVVAHSAPLSTYAFFTVL